MLPIPLSTLIVLDLAEPFHVPQVMMHVQLPTDLLDVEGGKDLLILPIMYPH